MSYTYERFGAITLPTYNRTSDMSPVAAPGSILQTLAGAFDNDGSARAQAKMPQILTVRCVLAESTNVAQRSAMDALRAAVGLRGNLYRIADSDGTSQRALCRLVGMDVERSTKYKFSQEITLRFAQLSQWLGTVHTGPWVLDAGVLLNDGYLLDVVNPVYTLSTPTTVWLSNDGNIPHSDVIMAVTVLSGTLSALGINGSGVEMIYSGVVTTGRTLTIDFGAQSVTVDGSNAYAGLTLTANHTIEEWLVVNPGANSLYLNPVGGATIKVSFQYIDRWA